MSNEKNQTRHENPFFNQPYGTPHNTAPFQDIKLEHYEPAILEGIRRENETIDKIINNPEAPTFDNTIAYTTPDNMLSRVTEVFFNLLSAETNDAMDELAQKMSPILTEHANNIMLNEQLFARVKQVYENHGPLDAEEQMLLDKMYDGFIRSGVNLSAEDKEKFRAISKELSQLTLQFSQNQLKETNNFQLHLTDEQDLKGLPDSAIEAARLAAKEKNLEGWVFTLHAPSYSPFMTYADNRALREQMYRAANTICTKDNEYNNLEIVKRIVNLRREKAQLLGYRTYADFVLKQRMAETSEQVYRLLNDLLEAYLSTAKAEVAEIIALAKKLEGDDFDFRPWDFSYYSHKLRMEKYNIDAEMLRPYLELEQVKKGVFGLATRLYGITFRENKDIPVYHPDVHAYEVFDEDGSFLAVLYTDFHPREGKRSGAWMTSYKDQWIDDDDDMQEGDLEGDIDNDCLMIDRNKDGQYGGYGDLIVDWVGADDAGNPAMQVVVDNIPEADRMRTGNGHYMWVIDTDKDNVFNYIDWNTFTLRCWIHNGMADFYEDYNGKSTFLKIHSSTERVNDVRMNWENDSLRSIAPMWSR